MPPQENLKEYSSVNDFLFNSQNPGVDIQENADNVQQLILEEIGLKDASFQIMKVVDSIYDIKKGDIIAKTEFGYILTENGMYIPDDMNGNLENSIAKGSPTVGILLPSADKKVVNYLPDPKYK